MIFPGGDYCHQTHNIADSEPTYGLKIIFVNFTKLSLYDVFYLICYPVTFIKQFHKPIYFFRCEKIFATLYERNCTLNV